MGQDGDPSDIRERVLQDLEQLGVQTEARGTGHPGDVPFRATDIRHQPDLDGIAVEQDRDHRDGRVGRLRHNACVDRAGHDAFDAKVNQLGGVDRVQILVAPGPPILDRDVLIFDVAQLAQPVPERIPLRLGSVSHHADPSAADGQHGRLNCPAAGEHAQASEAQPRAEKLATTANKHGPLLVTSIDR
jgi:hypothetical protein